MPPIANASSTLPSTSNRVAPLLLLCPLLAVSDSVINALGLSAVAIAVTVIASIPLSVTLRGLPAYGRIAATIAIVAGAVTCAMLFANAFFHDLYLAIGHFLPLLAAGGLLLARFEIDPSHATNAALMMGGLRTGLKFAAVLLGIGAAREWVSHGSLFFGAAMIPIPGIASLDTQFFHPNMGFVLAALPPGAFIAMGVLFALRNWLRARTHR